MSKIEIDGTWGIAGVVTAIRRIRQAGPNGKTLVNKVEAGKFNVFIESVDKLPEYKDGKMTTELPLNTSGGGATVPPDHPLGKGAIRIYIKFHYLSNYLTKDGSRVKMTRDLLMAHELAHCRAIQEGHKSDYQVHKLAIRYANPVFLELGFNERKEIT